MTHGSVKFALLAVSSLYTGNVVFAAGLPQGGVVQQGAAGIQYSGDTLNIDQSTDKAIISWKSFSVGTGNTVNFNQPSSDSATLNRVTGDLTSEIAGRINANGSVFLVNPNGILITADGVVDTGNFVASTLDIDNNDFLNGDYTFAKSGTNGVVDNRGSISVDDGGFVVLLGGAVKNDGTVRAFVGKVGFAGGEKIVMSFGNSDFLRVEVPTDKWNTLTDSQGNKVSATLNLGGKVDSRGGFIDITVADASDILRQTISIDGIVSANTVSSTDGVISISGGTVGITGNGRITADAAYGNAGTIAIEADTIDSSGTVSAAAQNGVGGKIKVSLQHGANLNAGTRFDVSGSNKGGNLSFIGGLGKSGTKVLGSADFKADGTNGTGGTIDISNKGGLVGLLSGTVSATGKTQGGRIRLGGAFQGGTYDPKTSLLDKNTQNLFVTRWGDNSDLVSAGKTSLGTGVNVVVSSTSGTGGTAILWADHTTNNYASIDATGVSGGAVEISGKKQVDSFGLKRVHAGNGVILLDPKNVVIGGAWGSALGQVKKIAHGVGLKNGRVSLDSYDYFGSSVALSDGGRKLAVGATNDDGYSGYSVSNYGAVYLYIISGSEWGDTITQKKKITQGTTLAGGGSLELSPHDSFGSSVSLSDDGNKLAVGATGDSDNSGAVYLFTITGNAWDTITKKKRITRNTGLSSSGHVSQILGGYFGSSVSLSANGSKLAVGAERYDSGRGAVYLFTITGNAWNTVKQNKKIGRNTILSGGGRITLKNYDNFGSAVSLSDDGTKLAVGAKQDDTGAWDAGAVYLFTVTGSAWNTIKKVKKITHGTRLADESKFALGSYDNFGSGVSLSADGSKLAVGARGDDTGGFGSNKGAVYLFTVTGNAWDTIQQVKKITHGTNFAGGGSISLGRGHYFGSSVSLNDDGTKLAVGASSDNTGKTHAGAVYLINISKSSGSSDAADLQQQLNAGTHLKIIAGNDITVNRNIKTTKGGRLTLVAGRSITINADVKINGGLTLKANDNIYGRDAGKAHITVAKGKTISAGNNDLIIKMLKGKNGASANKKQTGKITIWKADGKRVSIVHSGKKTYTSDSQIVILNGGKIKTNGYLYRGSVGIELVADTFINQSDRYALDLSSGWGRYLIWTKSPKGNTLNGINSYDTRFNTAYNFNGGDFQSNPVDPYGADRSHRSALLYSDDKYSPQNPDDGHDDNDDNDDNNGGNGGKPDDKPDNNGGGDSDDSHNWHTHSGYDGDGRGRSGGGAAGAAGGVVLLGAGAALISSGGGSVCGGWHGRCSSDLASNSTDNIFDTGMYAHLNGIDMQAITRPLRPQQPKNPLWASVFHTAQAPQVKYRTKYTTTYDMAFLANNIKAQKSLPLYDMDEKMYETIREIFVQQSVPADHIARVKTNGNASA